MEMVVGLRANVSGLQKQTFSFRACRWSWLGWPRARRPLGWFHLEGGHFSQVAPFKDAGGELLEMCIGLYPSLLEAP